MVLRYDPTNLRRRNLDATVNIDPKSRLDPLHKSRRKDLQVGQETAEIPVPSKVVVREAGEQEA